MKAIYLSLLTLFFFPSIIYSQDASKIANMDLTAKEIAHFMSPGWNLGNTLEGCNVSHLDTNNGGVEAETSWQKTKTTREIIHMVKQQGFKSVRIPCGWVAGHIDNAESTTINQKWMARVKEIVDYCLDEGLFVILNDHWDGGWIEHNGFTPSADTYARKNKLQRIWRQIAESFKDYDERLLFAGLNEPGVGGGSREKILPDSLLSKRLLEYEQVFINTVRATGGKNEKRVLVVQGPHTDISKTCRFATEMPKDYISDRLMMEIHYYDPYAFTMMTNDADWGNMQIYWNEEDCNYTSSNHKGTCDDTFIENSMKMMRESFVDKGYPVIMGEFGAIWRNVENIEGESQEMHNKSLQHWNKTVVASSMRNGIIPFVWDTNHTARPSMTVIDRTNCQVFNPYIVNGIMDGVKEAKEDFCRIYPAHDCKPYKKVIKKRKNWNSTKQHCK